MPLLIAWLFLLAAIVLEVAATTCLGRSDGMQRPAPAIGALALYGGAFYCLAQALRTLPLGVAYAVWCGVGIVSIALVSVLFYRQSLSATAWCGVGLILAGTLMASLSGAAHKS